MTTGGGETRDAPSGWTVDTLRVYFERVVTDLSDKYDERDERSREALTLALAELRGRLETMNEIRGQLGDQAATFMPRSEAEARTAALAEKVDALATRIDKTEGRSGGRSDSWGYLVGGAGLLLALAALVLQNLR